ncbi:MAG: BamA/TamA family outer membrane protein [Acidobacteria bacterium]|nr:BamA/TamA family outer membrane protein [Acidobacteriota bacterium]
MICRARLPRRAERAKQMLPTSQGRNSAYHGISRASPWLVLALLLPWSAASAQDAPAPQPERPLLQALRIEGASVYTTAEIATRHRLALGAPLTRDPEAIARDIRNRYRDDGYTLATVTAAFDQPTGTLAIDIDEGRFDAIDVSGVRDAARERLLEDIALQPGEIFNASQANRALDEALAFAQGAIQRAEPTFTLASDAGRRVLRIALRTRDHEHGAFAGTRGREDWYSPVDALNFGLGFHGTIFDQTRFNHAYWAGYVTYKFGPDRAGYSVGFERPFFGNGVLQVGASIHDLTASDDRWRLGDTEQSLVALTFRNTFRDYYRRKGYQIQAALRPLDEHELLVAWRDDEHLALRNTTSYGFFRDAHPFRGNAPADAGDLRAVLVGYTFDSRGFGRQPASERYRRHLLDDFFGDSTDRAEGVRADWRSELAPASLDHDFDFSRHIANVRGWWQPSPRRTISGRVVVGTSTGEIPPQRVFALGGIGTVHGYGFKEAAGDRMLLLNGEIRQRFFGHGDGVAGLLFVDAGRIYGPRVGTEAWMRGVGVGLEFGGGPRIELGWRLDDIPRSLQVLFRLRPTF